MGPFKVALMVYLMRVYIMCTDRILMDSGKKKRPEGLLFYTKKMRMN